MKADIYFNSSSIACFSVWLLNASLLLLPLIAHSQTTESMQEDEWSMEEWGEEDVKDYRITGFVEAAAGLRLANDTAIDTDKTLADLRAQLQFDYDLSASRLALTADIYYDGVLDQAKVQIREAAWQGNLASLGDWGKQFDLKIGQQVLTWGTGDYVFLNDLFAKDFQSFFAGRDDEYLKAPSLSAKLSGFFEAFNVDLVITPEFTADNYINGDYFSFFSPLAGQQVAPGFDVSSPLLPESPEYALRIYKSIGAAEFALYAYDGLHKSPNSFTPEFLPTFSSLSVYGASVVTTLGLGLFNTEFAYYDSTDDNAGTNPYIPNDQWRFLLAYEQELVKNLSASVQWYIERTQDFKALKQNSLAPEYDPNRSRVLLTQRLRYRAMQQTLTLNLFNFYSTSDQDGYLKLSADYSPADNWRLSTGANLFYGDQVFTFFGQFEDASNVFVRFRYFY